MGQLMGKEVLYEPLKELNVKVSTFSSRSVLLSVDVSMYSSRPTSPRTRTIFRRQTWHDSRRNTSAPQRLLPYSKTLGTKMTIPRREPRSWN